MSRPSVGYRQDAHLASLFSWALLSAAVAAVLFIHSGKLLSRPLAAAEIGGGIALLLFGPVGLAIYLWRARQVWVSVEPSRGVQIGGGAVIPWQAIDRIERRRPRLRSRAGPAELASFRDLTGDGSACADALLWLVHSGPLVFGVFLLVPALFVFWVVFVVFVPLLLVPVLEIYAPLGDRIRIVVRDGRSLVLRDLRNADGFLTEVRGRVRVVES